MILCAKLTFFDEKHYVILLLFDKLFIESDSLNLKNNTWPIVNRYYALNALKIVLECDRYNPAKYNTNLCNLSEFAVEIKKVNDAIGHRR